MIKSIVLFPCFPTSLFQHAKIPVIVVGVESLQWVCSCLTWDSDGIVAALHLKLMENLLTNVDLQTAESANDQLDLDLRLCPFGSAVLNYGSKCLYFCERVSYFKYCSTMSHEDYSTMLLCR
jgi:hypothetical protein